MLGFYTTVLSRKILFGRQASRYLRFFAIGSLVFIPLIQISRWPLLRDQYPSRAYTTPCSPSPQCDATLVTAYYNISSKHKYEEYTFWIQNFLTLQDCMIIFTTPD